MSQRPTDVALERGLFHRLIDGNGMVNPDAWAAAVDAGDIVGECRRCDGFMRAVACPAADRTKWFTAQCMNCGADIAAPARHMPGPLVLRRSSRHDEMKPGSMNTRVELLTQMRELAKRKAEADS